MNITKTIGGLVSVMALTVVTAGASMAQVSFSYSTLFSPPAVPIPNIGNFVTITNGGTPILTTFQTPTDINLANFQEFTVPPSTTTVIPPTMFTETLNITVGGVTKTNVYDGTISGSFSPTQSHVSIDPTTITPAVGSSYVFNFGAAGTISLVPPTGASTIFEYTVPGPSSSPTLGALSTGVVSNLTQTPEPATVVPFALGGLGLLGLIVRKTRRMNGAAA